MKRLLAMILAVAMVLSCFSACGDSSTDSSVTTAANGSDTTVDTDSDSTENPTEPVDPYADYEIWVENDDGTVSIDFEEYTALSAAIYSDVLGDYYDYYQAASEAESVSEKYALYAIAEAKLLEECVFVSTTYNGGGQAMSRVMVRSGDYALWGSDSDRMHNYVVTNEMITVADRNYLKELWEELRGTGTYLESAKAYLTEQGYTFDDEYVNSYSGDAETFDILATSQATDSEKVIQCVDGLVEYDSEGTLQPALAESWEVSDDGLTWTFHIREGVTWVDSQGRYVADVTADDWVAAMQHMLDAAGGLEYLVDGEVGMAIVGAYEYLSGEITDFSEVGVKAVDTYTLQYTLESPCSFFETMLGYSIFLPMSRSYYTSQGGKFGDEYDPSASDYYYGTTFENIAYCGPFIITQYTNENTIKWEYNESYWNPDNMQIHSITWLYNDGSDVTKQYNDFISGLVDSVSISTSIAAIAAADGYSTDNYIYRSDLGTTSYLAFYNIYRTAFANFNDSTTLVSTLSDEEATRTNIAMLNVHFRRAITYAVDRISYNAQFYGDEIAAVRVSNSYVPGDFVVLEEEVTVDINGTATTFPAGTYYGEIRQAQLDADGVAIKSWDPDTNSSAGYDGYYNVENAVAELEIAIEELAAQGVVIDEDNPIHIEFVTTGAVETYVNGANAWKQSVEDALGGLVVIDIQAADATSDWYYACYYFSYGYEANFTINTLSGWGPDYGDPSTYLGTFLDSYSGYMVKSIGIY
ncbi:MAG: ABC transporter substrate-binding protein [Ruminococcus sp.]|nr:ABC transporter substrate-binding protein [Ruminococcus sp.]